VNYEMDLVNHEVVVRELRGGPHADQGEAIFGKPMTSGHKKAADIQRLRFIIFFVMQE
jgi:hypothetical protein